MSGEQLPSFDQLLEQTPVLSVSGLTPRHASDKILGLCYDSREAALGNLFFALPGSHENGARFALEAVEKGALGVVAEEEIPNLTVPLVRVANSRLAMADIAAAFYGWPSRTLAVCGITGTNGKTTTSYLVRHLCEANGRACGIIGTIGYILPGVVEVASRTTPESIDLQRMLATMNVGGFRAVAMEVSSHAIVQERVRKIEFDAAIFTNLTQDHLDYHGTMDAYFEAKARLFSQLAHQTTKKGRAIINADDRYAHLLRERLPSSVNTMTFGQGSHADFRASDIQYEATGTTFRLDARGRSYLVRSPLIGLFNVYNALAALASATSMGLELRRAVSALATAPQVPGRLQRVAGRRSFQVFVDYAHTPDALENALRSLRLLRPQRLIVVFGCGGDRDHTKRPLMAAAAEGHADWVIVTSDNPRSEDPSTIIAETVTGFRGASYQICLDRENAIRRAVELAAPGDIVLLAGKGHETYQESAGIRRPFDDVAVARRVMSDKPVEATH